jgi:hypothetical protein
MMNQRPSVWQSVWQFVTPSRPQSSPFSNNATSQPQSSPFSNDATSQPQSSPFSNDTTSQPQSSPFSNNATSQPQSSPFSNNATLQQPIANASRFTYNPPVINNHQDDEEEEEEVEDKAILFVSTHGEISCSENNDEVNMNYIIIPEGMKITKITIGFQGNVNRMGVGSYEFALDLIDNIFKDKLLSHNDTVVDKAIDEIIHEVKDLGKYGVINDINNLNKKKRKNEEESYTVLDYIHGMNNSVEKFVLVGGDRIANKIYSRGREDRLKKLGDLDYTITILNSPDKKDIISDMKRTTRYGTQEITTEEVLNYFHSRGINNLIIFDYSCSVYGINTKSNKRIRLLKDRELRSFRNRHREDAYGGKSKKIKIKIKKSRTTINKKIKRSRTKTRMNSRRNKKYKNK